ncbi:MAG: histidinol dehydrogenase [Proteobacteria bacterium]|nr:histidinol dehydrogenase [Pseudomonadota bacterium]
MTPLKTITLHELSAHPAVPVDAQAEAIARDIINDVGARGIDAVLEYAVRFGDIAKGAAPVLSPAALKAAHDALPEETRALLHRTAERIKTFANAQRNALAELTLDIPGGQVGHNLAPVERAGCYAPSGRFPLPSSVLMTAVTARCAGVSEVWLASPKPDTLTMAAAHVAGVDGFLAVGGAQAIAALALGAGEVPKVDVIVGPGNKYVTAAKKLVSGQVAIDMLAGPSELTVLADDTADPDVVAWDLLAQAEHDDDAIPVLVTTDATLPARVNDALVRHLATLPTAATARRALQNGFALIADTLDDAIRACDILAPEHLEVQTRHAEAVAARCQHYGGLFIGAGAAEVLGDYGAGPNHTLPTGGTARYTGGLSVFHFIRIRTWMRIGDPSAARAMATDAAALAKLEGLAAHAQSAACRTKSD